MTRFFRNFSVRLSPEYFRPNCIQERRLHRFARFRNGPFCGARALRRKNSHITISDRRVGWELFRAILNPPAYSLTLLSDVQLTPDLLNNQFVAFPAAPVHLDRSLTQDLARREWSAIRRRSLRGGIGQKIRTSRNTFDSERFDAHDLESDKPRRVRSNAALKLSGQKLLPTTLLNNAARLKPRPGTTHRRNW
jgi:hypothetical protein